MTAIGTSSPTGANFVVSSARPMRILIADDDEDGFVPICAGLEHEGHVVMQAFDGEEALQQLTDGAFDVALVDLDMPKRDGISLVQELRARSIELPIVLASGNGSVRQVARQLGIEHSISKPFGIDEVIAVLSKLSPPLPNVDDGAGPDGSAHGFSANEAATQVRLRYRVSPAKAEGDG